jgi:pimeloyl-ACP methyl ester carboxylesterase
VEWLAPKVARISSTAFIERCRRLYGRALLAERLRTVVAPDGRTVGFARWGDPDGFPVFGNHGCPGCRLARWPDETLYADLGVLLITRDRPGYAKSTRRHGRSVVDDVDDLVLVADHLGIDRFAVSGASGGGPHALACAARLPHRVVAANVAVSPAPVGPGGMEYDAWINGMDPENVAFSKLEIAGDEPQLTEKLEELRLHIASNVAADPTVGIENFTLSDADKASANHPEVARVMVESDLEWTQGDVGGWVDDSLALARPWGFDLNEIAVPVLLSYGLTDVFVPPDHGRWLAKRIPGCEAWVDDEAGHFDPDPANGLRRRLQWLLDRHA